MIEKLAPFLPEGALPIVQEQFKNERYHLIVTQPRKTKHGDFRPGMNGANPRITVNGNLNPFAFLITLVHELAHLKVWNSHKNTVKPHGEVWKNCYANLLKAYAEKNIFPETLQPAIIQHIQNPKYASCADANLTIALRKFDDEPTTTLLQELPLGTTFQFNNRIFISQKKLRTRYVCTDQNNGLNYRIHGLAEVVAKTN